jgi:DNA-binding response OmpR family regulator
LSGINGIIDLGDFRIDTVERKATLNGRQLPLTCEEFDVLIFLVAHPQRLVTPRTLLTTSWNVQSLYQTEFLRNLLSLGRKLDIAGAGKQYLRTEPWIIYRFDPGSLFATEG